VKQDPTFGSQAVVAEGQVRHLLLVGHKGLLEQGLCLCPGSVPRAERGLVASGVGAENGPILSRQQVQDFLADLQRGAVQCATGIEGRFHVVQQRAGAGRVSLVQPLLGGDQGRLQHDVQRLTRSVQHGFQRVARPFGGRVGRQQAGVGVLFGLVVAHQLERADLQLPGAGLFLAGR